MATYSRLESGMPSLLAPANSKLRRTLKVVGAVVGALVLGSIIYNNSTNNSSSGNTSQILPKSAHLTHSIPPFLSTERMSPIQSSCARYAGSPPANDMSLAHLIAVHNDDSIVSLGLLIQEIYDPADTYIVHVKLGIESPWLAPFYSAFAPCDNVVFVPDEERIEAGYGDMTDIQMELALIRAALTSPVQWTYALMMDGSSWPTMPTEERRAWFRQRPRGTSQTFYRNPDNTLAAICPGKKCNRSPSRCVDAEHCTEWTLTPGGLPIALGWQWIRFTHELAEWITTSPEVDEWIAFFDDPPNAPYPFVAPEEHFFGTLHWASPYRDLSDEEDFMFVDWDHTANCRWWPNPRRKQSPCYLSVLDVGDVVKSGRPFMRKVASGDTDIRKVLPMSQIKPTGVPIWGQEL